MSKVPQIKPEKFYGPNSTKFNLEKFSGPTRENSIQIREILSKLEKIEISLSFKLEKSRENWTS